MNIIEKEIAEREALIAIKDQKLIAAEEALLAAATLKEEADAIDVETLNAEIAELKGYLPQPTAAVEETTPEVNA